MSEKKRIGTTWVITDDDTGMYHIGEVDGGFDRQLLRQHIECYGPDELLVHLAHMTAMVINEHRSINASKHNETAQCCDKPGK